ncbi:GNAT family N-acetyltransferase [Mucilaginibacter sp. cycad4]|uniref:GNAT family N-acetyltransferase n=1 Tax=Mucilaginibacter sp. cycad4 TaxID=3342096 RepID=UPI002AABA746|nr:GNAT family N-acetyltransferase [Mucilaginibacter gossypii]WPU98102.1 GNAT family N-acetyltransferase [Mucilaginibacter gossypii]
MKTNITIRPFNETDRKRLREIYLLSRIQAFYWCDTEQFHIADFDIHTQDEEVWVATFGEEISGFIAIWTQDSFIHHLYVDAVYRAKGIGKALLATAITNYPKPLKLKCLVKNEFAFAFYKAMDWQVIGKGDDELGDYYLMECG